MVRKAEIPGPKISTNLARPPGSPGIPGMVESIVGCKWSLAVLAHIRAGVARPGRLERAIAGISTKVLSQRLDKFLRFGIVQRQVFPEIPPRVEYRLTPLGERFCRIVDEIESLDRQVREEQ